METNNLNIMEILRNGLSSSTKQITCECSCVFSLDKTKDLRYWKQGINWPYYECPKCHKTNIDWEQANEDLKVEARIAVVDSTADAIRKSEKWWRRLFKRKEG